MTTSREQWEHVFAVNVTGPFLLTRHAVAHMVIQDTDGNGVNLVVDGGWTAS